MLNLLPPTSLLVTHAYEIATETVVTCKARQYQFNIRRFQFNKSPAVVWQETKEFTHIQVESHHTSSSVSYKSCILSWFDCRTFSSAFSDLIAQLSLFCHSHTRRTGGQIGHNWLDKYCCSYVAAYPYSAELSAILLLVSH